MFCPLLVTVIWLADAPKIFTAPLSEFRLLTPDDPPEAPERQELKLKTPLPLVVKHWPIVPFAVGRVKTRLALVIPD